VPEDGFAAAAASVQPSSWGYLSSFEPSGSGPEVLWPSRECLGCFHEPVVCNLQDLALQGADQ
jgi:hypothetical protein